MLKAEGRMRDAEEKKRKAGCGMRDGGFRRQDAGCKGCGKADAERRTRISTEQQKNKITNKRFRSVSPWNKIKQTIKKTLICFDRSNKKVNLHLL
jgi:hypothetical protein